MDFSTCATAFFSFTTFAGCLTLWQLAPPGIQKRVSNLITPQISEAYFAAKFLASFLSGGAVIVLPMIVNVIFVACTVPMRLPSVLEVIYNGVYGFGLWAEVFYTHPVLYILLYLLLDFSCRARLPAIPMALYKLKNRGLVLILPFLTLMVFHIFLSLLYRFIPFCLSPLDFLRAVNVSPYGANLWIVAAEFILLLLPGMLTVLAWRKKDVL